MRGYSPCLRGRHDFTLTKLAFHRLQANDSTPTCRHFTARVASLAPHPCCYATHLPPRGKARIDTEIKLRTPRKRRVRSLRQTVNFTVCFFLPYFLYVALKRYLYIVKESDHHILLFLLAFLKYRCRLLCLFSLLMVSK